MTAKSPTPAKPALRSVTIAFDILDAFFGDTEIGLSELARRVGVTKSTMHRTCGVLVDRGAARADAKRQVSPRSASARIRPTRHHPFGSAHTGIPLAGRTAQRHRRDRSTRCAVGGRRALHRTSRRTRCAPFQHRGGQALPRPSVERRKGDRRVSTGGRRGADQGRDDAIHGAHDRHPSDAGRRARRGSASVATRSASTKVRSDCRRSASRFATNPTVR